MPIEKSTLRTQLLHRRMAIDPELRAAKQHLITQALIDSRDWSTVHSVHIYSAIGSIGEVDTSAFQAEMATTYPNVTFDRAPQTPTKPFPRTEYDVIIVPVLGYDATSNRLGMGGGWYDRFLKMQPNAYTIGLAFTECFVDQLPLEPHDVPLDRIIAA